MSDQNAPESSQSQLTKELEHASDTAGWTKALLENLEPVDIEQLLTMSYEIPAPPTPTEEEVAAAALRDDNDVRQVESFKERQAEWEELVSAAGKEFNEKKTAFLAEVGERLNELMKVSQHQALAKLNLARIQTEFVINLFNFIAVLMVGGQLPNDSGDPIVLEHGLFELLNVLGNNLGTGGGIIKPPGAA